MLQIASETIARDAPGRRASPTAKEDEKLRRLGRRLAEAEVQSIAASERFTAALTEFGKRLPPQPEALKKSGFSGRWRPEDGYYSLEDVRRIAKGQRLNNGSVSPDWKEKLRVAEEYEAALAALREELELRAIRRAARIADDRLDRLRDKIGRMTGGGVKTLAVRQRALARPERGEAPGLDETLESLEMQFEAARDNHRAADEREWEAHRKWCRLAPEPHDNIREGSRGRHIPPSDTVLPYPEARRIWSAEALRRYAKGHPIEEDRRMAEEDIPLAEAYAAGMAEAERVTRRLELREEVIRLRDEVHAAAARVFAAPATTLADFAIKARVLKKVAFTWWEHGEDNPHHRAAAQLVDAVVVFAAAVG